MRRKKFVALGGSEDSKKYKSYQYDIDQLAKTIEYAKGELQDLEETGRAFTSALGSETPTQQYAQLESETLSKLDEKISITKKMG